MYRKISSHDTLINHDVTTDISTDALSNFTSDVTSEESTDYRTTNFLQTQFFHYIKVCDVSSVRSLLADHSNFDLNCKNYQGMTGLNLAIEVNCEQMVDLLLPMSGLDIGDSLMHAIRGNHYPIAIKLLEILESKNPESVKLGYEHSTEFPQHLTPLMLAAECGHVKIISLLLKRGHTISLPHKPQCVCKEVCKSLVQLNNGLGAAEFKLSVFRALANPSYISLTSQDPILTAFQLSKILREHGNVDRIFKSDYELLNSQTRMFAVHLIGLCRSSSEVEQILTRKEGCNFFGAFPYQRLVMAMDLKQKEFVAHAYVQQTLETAWSGDWFQWRRYSAVHKIFLIFLRVVLLPMISILYLVTPFSEKGRHYALPVNRMINYLSSYAIFLVILTVENNLDKTGSMRDPLDLALKCATVVYVVSFIIRTVKLILVQGPKRYFSMLWNVYDCFQLGILVVTFTCWWTTYLDLDDEDQDVARKYWEPLDSRLVAEGLLAVATVMSYLRLLFLCQLSYALGPMQVSLGKMTTDFARFAILFGIIILAFTVGLCRLYQYYEGMTKSDPVSGAEVTQEDSFVNIFATLKTLFWGIFCMTSSTAGSVVIETTINDADSEEYVATNHYFTQAVGTLLFALFEIIAVIVMLNMLIATMTNTFQRVTENSYIEWVFGRTQVFLSFSVHTELPPPLNFIPTLHCGVDAFGCLRNCFNAGASGVANLISSKRHTSKSNAAEDGYRILMSKIIRRYFREKLSNGFSRNCNPICCQKFNHN